MYTNIALYSQKYFVESYKQCFENVTFIVESIKYFERYCSYRY